VVNDSSAMLSHKIFDYLTQAVKELTYANDELEAGLKTAYYFLLR
jgi:hypothetical protein